MDINYYKNYIGFYNDKNDLAELSEKYSEQYNESISKYDILINSDRADTLYKNETAYKCIVDYGVNKTINTSKDLSIREIYTRHSDGFNVGDIVQLENKISKEIDTYLFTSSAETEEGYDKSYIQKCNNTLKVYKNGILCQIPCIVNKGIVSTDDNRIISLSENEYSVLVSYANLQNIFLNQRYLLSGDAYSLQGIDKLSQVGLLNLKIKKDVINDNDDLINGIAYNGENLSTDEYEVKLLNNPLVTLTHWSIWQLEYEILKNGNVVDLPVVFSSSNSTSVSVDSSGRCVALNVSGTSTIKIMLQSNPNIFTFMTITVSNAIEHNYTVSIDGDSFIYLGESKQFTSSVRDLGVLIPNANVIWSLDYNNNPSSIALMSNTSDNKIVSILANANTTVGVIKLIAKYTDDPTKMFIKEIEIKRKSLW